MVTILITIVPISFITLYYSGAYDVDASNGLASKFCIRIYRYHITIIHYVRHNNNDNYFTI